MRFDVETIYKATYVSFSIQMDVLRFDVETIYKATTRAEHIIGNMLRFDVETIYKATKINQLIRVRRCGLM